MVWGRRPGPRRIPDCEAPPPPTGESAVPIEVTMPKLSPTMESGVITQWLGKVGDVVKEEDVLAEVEADKATMPMKSYEDGDGAPLDVAVGDEVALGQRVLVLAKRGEDPKQVAQSFQGGGKSAPVGA